MYIGIPLWGIYAVHSSHAQVYRLNRSMRAGVAFWDDRFYIFIRLATVLMIRNSKFEYPVCWQ